MKIYRFMSNATNARHLCPADEDVWESIGQPKWFEGYEDRLWLHGESMKEIWEPIDFAFCKYTADKPLNDCIYSDFYPPILNQNSVHTLMDLFIDYVEILPINVLDDNTTNYFILNVIYAPDLLDAERSELTSSSPKKHKYFFISEKVAMLNLTLFKVPQFLGTRWCFATDVFVDQVLTSELSGFKFVEVWSN